MALDPEGKNLIHGECKYWQEPVSITVLQDLESKTSSIEWRRNQRHVWYVLFSASGFTDKLKELAKQRTDLLLFDEQTD